MKQGTSHKEIQEQLFNSVQYKDKAQETFWFSKTQEITHVKIKKKDNHGCVF